jgi:DNA-binding transcriptional ArsR family regulator
LFDIELSFITKYSTNGLNKGRLDKLSTHWLNIFGIEDKAGIGMMEIGARKAAASRAARLDAVFAALADPTRRAIIERLSHGEARVTEIAEPFHMSLNAVSKHIRVLEASGVVERHKKGRDHILSINTRSLDEADGWIERMRCYWEERLDAMEHLLGELKKERKLGPKGRRHGSR